MAVPQPSAFDAFAATYDEAFSNTRLAQLLRPRVWRELAAHFAPGDHVLELACGTGVDAVWLARQGVRVTATDGSPHMVEATRRRAAEAGVAPLLSAHELSLQQLTGDWQAGAAAYDGAFSNFGGLNTVADLAPLAAGLAYGVRRGGRLVLVLMGPYCPWEVLWHLAHAEPATALRRWRQPAPARIGPQTIPIWYPPLRRLQSQLRPWFRHVKTRSLGLFLPPSYLGHLLDRFPRLFAHLNNVEQKLAPLTGSWGDHYLSVFARSSIPSNRS